MNTPDAPPKVIFLENLEKEYKKFLFIADPKGTTPKDIEEEEISIEAGKLVKELKQSLEKAYCKEDKEKASDDILEKRRESLTVLCVRIVFLLYAEDSELFGKRQFHDYLNARKIMAREALKELFEVLNQEYEKRDPYINQDLKNFPYVNGGLFEKKNIIIPDIDEEILNIILDKMSKGFDWSGINTAIFGSIFESVINDYDRQHGGMHYTSKKNIHKLIDPLFLDDLNSEFENISANYHGQALTENLIKFQNKLASLKFLDPACGSGNFLTESFISLREIENKILRVLKNSGNKTEIKVSIFQFYGIDADEFAVAVAQTALYIADNQMLNAAADIVKENPLPLKKYHNIRYASAMDKIKKDETWGPGWEINHDNMLYYMGNPPFLGYSMQSPGQKADLKKLFGTAKIDYVACWFGLAAQYMKTEKNVRAAFVATNSITQGEQVAPIFKTIEKENPIEIDFAHQSFIWDNEMTDEDKKAHVHCVIIGFSAKGQSKPGLKKLYTSEGLKLVENINFYLKPGPNYFIEARKDPICKDAPKMRGGNRPADGGHLLINSQEEYEEFIKKEPQAKKFIKRFMMASEFINKIPRYCLWLVDAKPNELSKMPLVMERIKLCKEDRLKGAPDRQKLADTAWLFRETFNFERFIAIPFISSEKRKYIPIGYLDDTVIPGDGGLQIIPNATLYHFGVLTSRVHMAWMRATAGRLKSDYRYSNTVVYNNFIWPCANEKQKSKIEKTAQKILDARDLYPESSFADLYNDDLMPVELNKAHKENDAAVCEAYGWPKDISENDIAAELFALYSKKS